MLILTLIFKDVLLICLGRKFCNLFFDRGANDMSSGRDVDDRSSARICHLEYHRKHVLPLWSLRSKWPIIQSDFFDFLATFCPGIGWEDAVQTTCHLLGSQMTCHLPGAWMMFGWHMPSALSSITRFHILTLSTCHPHIICISSWCTFHLKSRQLC